MMSGLFFTLLRISLYAGVVGIIILLAKKILQDKLNAQWHYLVWIVLLIKLLLPYGPQSAISFFNAVPDIPVQTQSTYSAPSELPQQEVQPKQPIVIPVPNDTLTAPVHTETITPFTILEFLPAIWAVGALLFFLWLFFTHFYLTWQLRQTSTVCSQRAAAILERAKAKMKVDKNITLLIQNRINAPALVGLIHPKILLTPDAAELNDQELEYILLHELAHYKRKDLYVNYVLLALQVVHWFNPVLWYCFKRIREDMEVATDEKVLSILTKPEHKAYGLTLLSVLDSITSPRLVPRLLGMVDWQQCKR